jgi:hypothetical protein
MKYALTLIPRHNFKYDRAGADPFIVKQLSSANRKNVDSNQFI